MTMTEYRYTYAAQILAGAYASAETGGRLSGCGSLENFLENHGPELVVGAWIVDGREVDPAEACHLSVKGPMVDGRLGVDADWDGSHWDAPTDGVSMMIAGNYGLAGAVVAQTVAADEPGPLDMVPPRYIARRWAAIGARVGRWNGESVDWD